MRWLYVCMDGVYDMYAIIVVIVCLHVHICFHRIVHNYYYYGCCCRGCCRYRYVYSLISFHSNLYTVYIYKHLIAFYIWAFFSSVYFSAILFNSFFFCFILMPHFKYMCVLFFLLCEYTITNLHVNKRHAMRCVHLSFYLFLFWA